MGKLRVFFAAALLFVTAAGCASYRSYRDGQIATQLEDWDQAVAHYMKALEQDPGNVQYRAALLRAKIEASQAHFKKAREFQEAGVLDRAMLELQQAVQLDPTNQYAEAELKHVRELLAAQQENRDYPGSIQELKDKTHGTRPQPPLLNPRSNTPIDLSFPEEVMIFQIYKALGKAFGINILFDPNLKDSPIAIELEGVDAQTALETLMRAASHFYKVLDEHTILIAADTPQNRRTYEDLVIQTFFLSNAEVKDIITILRSLVDSKKVAVNEQLNAVILRDTADKVKIAERIIQSNDKAKAEVVVDVELIQIDSGTLRDLGLSLSQQSIGVRLDLGGEDIPLRVSDLGDLTQNNWVLSIPNFTYNLVKNSSSAQLLAKPRLRITEGEQARLVIGDRVPIPVTTFNTANTVGGNVVPITSFQYQEVGITIEVEPRVHHNKEITLKVRVEVSQISRMVANPGGPPQPVIGTRTIDTTIRLKDGETNLLAGLIRSDESQTDDGIPGISDIPLVGRLFSNKRRENQNTDVLLTLTPHIIRNAAITEEDLLPVWVGTEANITFRSGSPRVESTIEGPFDVEGGATPEEIQELMRRRIQQLPRGLQQGQPDSEEPTPTPGIDLVPGLTDPFNRNQPEDQPENQLEEPPLLEVPDQDQFENVLHEGFSFSEPVPAPTTLALARADQAAPTPVAAQPAGAAPVRVELAASRRSLRAGETLELRIEARADRPLSHLPMTLAYDPAVLVVERVEAGGFLGGATERAVMADTTVAGRVELGASRLGAVPGITGTGTVARVFLRALGPGQSMVSLEKARALGPELVEMPLAASAGTRIVVVDRPRNVPRPEVDPIPGPQP
jgi:general secretion pathway protein D